MCGSGVMTGTAKTITATVPAITLMGQEPVRTVFIVAVVGTTTRGACGRLVAMTVRRAFVAAAWVSVLFGYKSQVFCCRWRRKCRCKRGKRALARPVNTETEAGVVTKNILLPPFIFRSGLQSRLGLKVVWRPLSQWDVSTEVNRVSLLEKANLRG